MEHLDRSPGPTVVHLIDPIRQGGHGIDPDCREIPVDVPTDKFHAWHHNVHQGDLSHDHHDPAADHPGHVHVRYADNISADHPTNI